MSYFLQSIALPTAILEEELVPAAEFVPKNEGADFFREEIDRYFVRYLSFYDRTTAQLRNYRLSHVDVVTAIYQSMMTIFGDDIESVRQASYEMNDLIDEKRNEIGSVNDCLRGIIDDRTANARVVGSTIQSCALFANTTLQGLLRETFYPVFAEIQTRVSTVPLVVIEILAR